MDTSKEVVIIRDLNARMPDMSCFSKASINVNYTANPDTRKCSWEGDPKHL